MLGKLHLSLWNELLLYLYVMMPALLMKRFDKRNAGAQKSFCYNSTEAVPITGRRLFSPVLYNVLQKMPVSFPVIEFWTGIQFVGRAVSRMYRACSERTSNRKCVS